MLGWPPDRDDDDKIIGARVYVERVTEREEVLSQPEQHEDFNRILFERSPVGLNLCTMDGLWVESNPAFLHIIGYSREEADGGLTYWDLTPREYDAEEHKQLEQLNATGRYGPYEKEFIRKDGSRVPVCLNGFIVEREGTKYIWSLIEDIRARRSLEAQLEAERLKAIHASKLATLGEMAAGFAHEINNPLAIIEGYAYVLRDAIDPQKRELANEALDSISVAVQRAAKIVSGLRKFARDESGGAPQNVPVQELLDDSLALCITRLRNHGVELRKTIATDRTIRGNPIELSQVLVNLINNAFDAVRGEPDGWISIAAADDEDHVVLRVRDSGRGIKQAHLDRIFHPFFTTKSVGEGTGLGLSISSGLIQNMGGTLRYDADDQDTCFVVRIPVGEEEEESGD